MRDDLEIIGEFSSKYLNFPFFFGWEGEIISKILAKLEGKLSPSMPYISGKSMWSQKRQHSLISGPHFFTNRPHFFFFFFFFFKKKLNKLFHQCHIYTVHCHPLDAATCLNRLYVFIRPPLIKTLIKNTFPFPFHYSNSNFYNHSLLKKNHIL